MADLIRRQGNCAWLPSDDGAMQVLRQVTGIEGQGVINADQGLPGSLTLTHSELIWEISSVVRRIVDVAVKMTHAAVPPDLLDRLTWRLPLVEIRELHAEGTLFAQSLRVVHGDSAEVFRLRGAAGWRRAIQDATGIVPDEGLSRAGAPDDQPESTSLSPAEEPPGRGGHARGAG